MSEILPRTHFGLFASYAEYFRASVYQESMFWNQGLQAIFVAWTSRFISWCKGLLFDIFRQTESFLRRYQNNWCTYNSIE